MTNMDIWNKVAVTDPKHTKDFKRSGGFSGTAIKPMYAIQKMTEVFGPCGTGWGYTKPEYQIVDGTDGQKLVYCTVGLWTGKCDHPYDMFWGVGGDFIVVKQSSGLRSDDEAFKKSFTDALMNAMKHIGMSADVHMGQFDGNKYIAPKADDSRRGGTKPDELAEEWPLEARQKVVKDLLNKLYTLERGKETEARTYSNKIIKNLRFVGSDDLANELQIALDDVLTKLKGE